MALLRNLKAVILILGYSPKFSCSFHVIPSSDPRVLYPMGIFGTLNLDVYQRRPDELRDLLLHVCYIDLM